MSTGSPTPSLESFSGTPIGSVIDSDPGRSLENSPPVSTTSSVLGGAGSSSLVCALCSETYQEPRVLSCFHTVCLACAERLYHASEGVVCPICSAITNKPPNLLIPDYAASRLIEASTEEPGICGLCKSRESVVFKCYECQKVLCHNCGLNHNVMGYDHRVYSLSDMAQRDDRPVSCVKHKSEPIQLMCTTCSVAICSDCAILDHPACNHNPQDLHQFGRFALDSFYQTLDSGKMRIHDMRACIKSAESTSSRMSYQYEKARKDIDENYKAHVAYLEERKQEVEKELETLYSTKQMALSQFAEKTQNNLEVVNHILDFGERTKKYSNSIETLMHTKAVEVKLSEQMSKNFEVGMQNVSDIEFIPTNSLQNVKNGLGYIRTVPDSQNKIGPIARPNNPITSMNSLNSCLNGLGLNNSLGLSNGVPSTQQLSALASQLGNYQQQQQSALQGSGLNGINGIASTLAALNSNSMVNNAGLNSGSMVRDLTTAANLQSLLANKRFQNTSNSFSNNSGLAIQDLNLNSNYEKWSSGDAYNSESLALGLSTTTDTLASDPKYLGLNTYPPRSQIKRQKMIYHCKFGEFGVLEGQFTEPSGVAVNAQNDIIVADTNNHRIQIFDKEGRFKFQFGECGKRDGQLLYPNRVAVVKTSGDIIVTERSPTHQIQIYNQYGQFVRKFGANTLCYPRGVTVDNKGRIIVIECKVMRVIIFDQLGNVGHQFNCPNHLEFPNGVVVNDRQEIFISDNRAHCVKVFSYDGAYLRQIGGEGLTNYPIGVGITTNGDVLIADNHNNFNLTLFTQDGTLVSAYESKVKHAQCFDVALMDDGSVVLASKDYRLYVYRYLQPPPHI